MRTSTKPDTFHPNDANSQEQCRQVVENLAEGLFVVQDNRIVFANRMAVDILHIPLDHIMGADPVVWLHPEDQPRALTLRESLQSQPDSHATEELRHIGHDGVIRWLSVRPRVVPWEGKPATLTYFTEVTEQRAMVEALRHSEERYRLVVEHSGEGMLVVQDGHFAFVNRRATELLRMGKEELMHRGYLHLIHPDDRAMVDERRRRRLAGEDVPNRYEIRLLMPDGEIRWLDIGVTLVPWDGAGATLTFFSDITERKMADAALQRTWAEREALLNTALVGMALIKGRTIQWANRRIADMLGYADNQLLGRSTEFLYDNQNEWEELGRLQHAALSAHSTYSHERALLRRDGRMLWVQMDGQCVEPYQPDAGVIWTLLDITERRQAELETHRALAQQKELNELRSRFVAMTSHEFRTPLAAILSSVELLTHYNERLSSQDRQDVLHTIQDSVHRMTHMLDRVLMLGRSDAGMLEFKPTPLNLKTWCQTLVDDVLAQWRSSQCTLHTDWALLPAQVVADEKLLHHIFSNLLTNAFKYSPQGGEVRFTAQARNGRELVFTVQDQGIGIPSTEIDHLFDSFHRASNVGHIAGTGLGLAIVKTAVQLHRGSIEVDSAVDRGTRFTVVLPCGVQDEAT
jgi:PAS domain S-box-containing protein